MKKKTLIILVMVVVAAAVAVWAYQDSREGGEAAFRTAAVERQSIRQTVSATGTLNAVSTVSVGTQVSGQVAELYVDFNDEVRKGQLLARIDPTLAQQAVADAESSLERTRAELDAAQRDHQRNRQLLDEGLVAESAFDSVESRMRVARAGVRSAQVAVDRARQNLAYTSIHAPIDGVVVERNVDVGQTVAASLSAPQLFLIANDLSEMQILAQVDESDIAAIQQGQAVSFSVQALPRESFRGEVRQVRLQSATQENVVNYTVVIAVDNTDGKLLPGMTALVDFEVASADDVLTVPNAALRFRPSEELLAQLRANAGAGGDESAAAPRRGPTTTGGAQAPRQRPAASGARRAGAADRGMLFYLDPAGNVRMTRVTVGISDGSVTEVSGPELREGMLVVTGTQGGSQSGSANPFGSGSNAPRGPRGAF